MAGNLNLLTNKMFRDMLVFDQVRGFDSTGIAYVGMKDDDSVIVEKELGGPENLWDFGTSKLLDDRGVVKTTPKVLIGHNRAATTGKVVLANAHPFEFDHITGVHNGSLTVWRDLDNYIKHDVDSQAIFDTIAAKGIDHTWKSFHGAACLVYWDAKTGTVNIIRNEQRPLCVAQSEAEDAIFWASEDWMIMVAANRAGVKLKRNENQKVVLATPKPHHLYTYAPTAAACPLKEVRELEKKSYQSTTIGTTCTTSHGHGGHGSFKGYTHSYKSFDQLPWKLVSGWADNLEKADKSLVGSEFRILRFVECNDQKTKHFYVYGQTKDGGRVEIYPSMPTEYPVWKERLNKTWDNDIWYKFTHRPRVMARATWQHASIPEAYRISTSCVELSRSTPLASRRAGAPPLVPGTNIVHNPPPPVDNVVPIKPEKLYKSFTGSVTELAWFEAMSHRSINHACTSCGDPIGIDQHRDIFWVNAHCVLCESCQKDQTIMDYVKSYNH